MITWDENKRKRNILEHGIDLADLEVVFDFPMHTTEDRTTDHTERRHRSLCLFQGRVVVLIWTEQNDTAKLISCRNGDKREHETYFQNAFF
ncbi:BrnT family toxin [Duganella levis]|uniref:BrnT family toxin n=1 Tax=Duganella levis TaxID=2692169 RepID=A0ABW9W2J5_9BURK|nr:BrnT family toxin [Duganella levis]MYN28003.1 BrnT family toxin [Duganella levis]